MKRLLLLVPALVIGLVTAFVPVTLTVAKGSLGVTLSVVDAAVTQNVFCKDGFSGYTADPTAFCKAHGGPADVSSGNRPYACVDKTVQTGPDAATACTAHGGGAVAAAAASGPCGANAVEIAVVFPGQTHCVDNSQPGGAIIAYLKVILAYLSTLIGAVIVLMIVIGGIQYIVSAGDPAQIKNAKTRIINAVVALFLFLAAFAILSFIVPGGIFG